MQVGGLVCALWTRAEAILLALGQDAAIAKGAAHFLQLSMPALLAAGMFECLKRYLMSQVGAVGHGGCADCG